VLTDVVGVAVAANTVSARAPPSMVLAEAVATTVPAHAPAGARRGYPL